LDGDGTWFYHSNDVNEEGFISREDLPYRALKDGDRVRFMLLWAAVELPDPSVQHA
jgi:hypothetical protein